MCAVYIPNKEIVKDVRKLRSAVLTDDGKEILNPEPLYLDVGPQRLSIAEQIQRIVRREISMNAAYQGFETFEESIDFDVPDEDPQPLTRYETVTMKDEVPVESASPNREKIVNAEPNQDVTEVKAEPEKTEA